MTARYVVVGDPIDHSLSPAIFARLFPAVGVDARMDLRRCTTAEMPALFAELRAGVLLGASVTLPLKERALALADERGEGATAAGATNCLVSSGGRVRAARRQGAEPLGHRLDRLGHRAPRRHDGGTKQQQSTLPGTRIPTRYASRP